VRRYEPPRRHDPAGGYDSLRRGEPQVRRQPPRRRRQRTSLRGGQVFALVVMAASIATGFALSVSPSFAAQKLELHGAVFTSPSVVRSILRMDSEPNIFRIQTDTAAQLLVRLPAVRSAVVHVRLPSTVIVDLVERQPRIVWVIGEKRFVADQDGDLFGEVDGAGNPIPSYAGPLPVRTPSPVPTRTPFPSRASDSPSPGDSGAESAPASSPESEATADASSDPGASASPGGPSLIPSLDPPPSADPNAISGPGALALPVVFDRRASSARLRLGDVLDATNLDAGYRLAGLTPADLGSAAQSLAVILDDDHGFTVSSVPVNWVAEFGFYAPTVRKVTVIPTQVRDLRSILDYAGEDYVAWVWLVADVSDRHQNVYRPK
jgi:hypothetical protein